MKSLRALLRPVAKHALRDIRATCALQGCRNTLLVRAVPQSRTGIHVGPDWYCSVDCFAAEARVRFASLSDGRVTEMPHTPRLSIGLVMLSKGILSDDQLRYAMTQSKMYGEDIETTLTRLGLAGERQLTAARAAQWGYPVCGQDGAGHAVEAELPKTLLQACTTAPLHFSPTSQRYLLGFVHRVEYGLMQALEQITGYRTEPCFITPTDFAEQMERVSGTPDYGELVIDEIKTPAQMSKIIGGLSVEISARDAAFTRCRNYAWTRITGKRQTVDVLFRIKAEFTNRRNPMILEEAVSSLG